MHKYIHAFFDLDKTLWDFDCNTTETFHDLFELYKLNSLGITDANEFLSNYQKHNNKLWDQYRKGKIEKSFLNKERFLLTLNDFDIKDEKLALRISNEYIRISPYKKKLMDGAIDILEYLYNRIQLHIITNGFEEVQHTKLKFSGLSSYFKTVTTSEEAGCHKPGLKIFSYALEKAMAIPSESIMIGDDFSVDISGAKDAGIDQVFYNLNNALIDGGATYEIKHLLELKKIFP